MMKGPPQTEPLNVATVAEGDAVPGTYCITGRVITDPKKLKAAWKWPLLKDEYKLRFLGLCT
jgi:hypothetical protein